MQTKNRKITLGCNLKDIYPVSIDECDLKTNDDFLDAMRYYSEQGNYYHNMLSASMEVKVDIPGMIDRVIFNDPATIIYWKDGSKTVVKRSEDDIWDPEKGFCMAVIKKLYGRTSFIKRFMEPEEEMSILTVTNIGSPMNPLITSEEACENLKNFGKKLNDMIGKGGKK